MDLYTTDAKIERYAIVALDDDRGFFPYDAVLLHRADVAKRLEPLRKLEGKIDAATMVRLNARAELDKVAFADVAREYLGARVRRTVVHAVRTRLRPAARRAPRPGVRLARDGGVRRHPAGPRRREIFMAGANRCSSRPACCRPSSLALLAFLIRWPRSDRGVAGADRRCSSMRDHAQYVYTGIAEVPRGLVQAGTVGGSPAAGPPRRAAPRPAR